MAEEKTIIIKNSDEEKKSNFTFKNYLTSIKIYRYWVLGVSLLVAVFAYLITALGINKNLSKVSSTFSYSFETQSYFGSDAKLLDGSTISINSIVGADTIRSVYENTLDEDGNKVFAKLSREDIMEDSNIALTKEKDEENIERKETDPVSVDTFILTANIKPFKTESNAKLFAKELIESLPKKISEIYSSAALTTISIGDSDDYYQSVDTLSTRYNLIDSTYGNLISKFSSAENVSSENKSLVEVKANFLSNVSISANITYVTQARSDLLKYGYVNNFTGDNKTETLALLNGKKEILEDRYNDTNTYITILKSAIDSYQHVYLATNQEGSDKVAVLSYEFEELIQEYQTAQYTLNSIQYEKDLVDKQIANVTNYTAEYVTGCTTFKNQIKKCVEVLNSESQKLSRVRTEVFLKHTSLSPMYSSTRAIEVKGTLPPILIGAAGLILGFIASSLIYTYVYINKLPASEEDTKKSDNKKVNSKA